MQWSTGAHGALASWHHQRYWSWNTTVRSQRLPCIITRHHYHWKKWKVLFLFPFWFGFQKEKKKLGKFSSFLSESVDFLLSPLFSPCLRMKSLMLFDHGHTGLCRACIRRWTKARKRINRGMLIHHNRGGAHQAKPYLLRKDSGCASLCESSMDK